MPWVLCGMSAGLRLTPLRVRCSASMHRDTPRRRTLQPTSRSAPPSHVATRRSTAAPCWKRGRWVYVCACMCRYGANQVFGLAIPAILIYVVGFQLCKVRVPLGAHKRPLKYPVSAGRSSSSTTSRGRASSKTLPCLQSTCLECPRECTLLRISRRE